MAEKLTANWEEKCKKINIFWPVTFSSSLFNTIWMRQMTCNTPYIHICEDGLGQTSISQVMDTIIFMDQNADVTKSSFIWLKTQLNNFPTEHPYEMELFSMDWKFHPLLIKMYAS